MKRHILGGLAGKLAVAAAIVLTGCGGGGGDDDDGSTLLRPSVTISATPSSITLGAATRIEWSSSNAGSCVADGAWSGDKATDGAESVTPTSSGTVEYVLRCKSEAGTTSVSTRVAVSEVAVPAPTVTISLADSSITTAETTTLTWSATDATACTATGAWSGSEAASGSISVSNSAAGSYTYGMTCTGPGGEGSNTTVLTVSAVGVTAPTVNISAVPSSITLGGNTSLSWSATDATSCTATGAWSGSKGVSGTLSVTPSSVGSISYGLTCTGTGGSASNATIVTVSPVATPAPTVSLGLSPSSITVGQNATLSWSATNATSCTGTGPAAWVGAKATSGSVTVTSSIAGSYDFGLSCTGTGGTTAETVTLVATSSGIATGLTVAVVAGKVGGAGVLDGALADARFSTPKSIAMDSSGNRYVVDTTGHVVRKITVDGVVSTFAGQAGTPGAVDGTGRGAKFRAPEGITVDSSGNVFVADSLNHCIRKITSAGVVTTLAGACGTLGAIDGNATTARFSSPAGIVTDGSGNVYVSDRLNRAIRKITSSGDVTTYAGALGLKGTTNGTSDVARFNSLGTGLVRASNGTLYLTDTNAVRSIDSTGYVDTYAGAISATGSNDDASVAINARFVAPQGLALDGSGNLYVADAGNSTIRKVAAGGGAVTTVAGAALFTGSTNGTGADARFNQATGIVVSGTNLIVADNSNHLIRNVTTAGVVTTLGGSLVASGADEGAGPAASFNTPKGLVVTSGGTIYVVDSANGVIRQISAGSTSVFAGTKGAFGSADGAVGTGRLSAPSDLALKSDGSLLVSDGNAIRSISTAGDITTLAGSVSVNGTTDSVTALSARFKSPRGIAVDSTGNVFIADTGNCTIRKMAPDGAVTTFAGTAASCSLVNATGTSARFKNPTALTIDSSDNLYVADVGTDGGSVLRKITSAGVVTSVAGTLNANGHVDATGTSARFGTITGLSILSGGSIIVADSATGTIRQVTPAGAVTTILGGDGQVGERTGSIAPLPGSPFGVFAQGATLYWTTNHAVLKAQ